MNFETLTNETKEKILMYLTARQFKNAIPIEEIWILPSQKGEWLNHCKINLNNLSYNEMVINNLIDNNSTLTLNDQITITLKGNKIITKTSPFIVNKSFACEVYLKFILKEENTNINDLKKVKDIVLINYIIN